MYRIILISSLVLIFQSCSEARLKPEEYVKWIENREHGLKKEKVIDDYRFILQYKPIEYVTLKEFGKTSINKVNEFNKRKHELDGFYYFNLDIISKDGKESVLSNKLLNDEDYYSRINYFTSFAQKNIKLVNESDTLQCTIYHFERTFDLSPNNTIVVAFKNNGKGQYKNDIQFIFQDKLLGSGDVKFTISRRDLKNIPKLIL